VALADLPVRRVVAVLVALTDAEGPAADVHVVADVWERAGVDARIWEPGTDLAGVLAAAQVVTA
jgi:hypothetical protein